MKDDNGYFNPDANPTVAEGMHHYFEVKRASWSKRTLTSEQGMRKNVVGPILDGDQKQKAQFTNTGIKPEGCKLIPMLGNRKVSELTTGDIRSWFLTIIELVGHHTARRGLGQLMAMLAMVREDYGIPVPDKPTNLPRKKSMKPRQVLTSPEVAQIVRWAWTDDEIGPAVAFPFLSGLRINEQLALNWEDVDFEAGVIHVNKTQERNGGEVKQGAKTDAGNREVPICQTLRDLLLHWREICPRLEDGTLDRVFSGPGFPKPWPEQGRRDSGKPLSETNFRKRYWKPGLEAAGVDYVNHHSARKSFISMLQSQGAELAVVSRMAGHSDINITLRAYTRAMTGGAEAVSRLDSLFGAPDVPEPAPASTVVQFPGSQAA